MRCEICRTERSAPVSSLDFRLSPFVLHAFGSGSAQGPVIWCLNQLHCRAQRSFVFAPTLEIIRYDNDDDKTDIDILASVDGRVYVVEVKTSFAGIDTDVVAELKRLGKELRPDVLLVAGPAMTMNGFRVRELRSPLAAALSGRSPRNDDDAARGRYFARLYTFSDFPPEAAAALSHLSSSAVRLTIERFPSVPSWFGNSEPSMRSVMVLLASSTDQVP